MHCPFGFNGTWRKIFISSSLSNKKKRKKKNTKYRKQSIILWYVFKCSKLYKAATSALSAFSSAHTREHVVVTWRGDMYQRQFSSCDLPFFCKIKISCRYQIIVPATFRKKFSWFDIICHEAVKKMTSIFKVTYFALVYIEMNWHFRVHQFAHCPCEMRPTHAHEEACPFTPHNLSSSVCWLRVSCRKQ